MRKIDKNCNLATAYKAWEEGFGEGNHDPYNSSENQYYLDVLMNLFSCQDGLCAYTEMKLCNPLYYVNNNWHSGRYVNPDAPNRPQVKGQLEHFDKNLKTNRAWLWSNLFMADTDINTKIKRAREVDYILKPDEDDYDENLLFEYDFTKHIFIPNSDLPEDKQIRIKKMIDVLGINFDPIVEARRMYLEPKLKLIEFDVHTWETTEIEQFPTAFNMTKLQLQNKV